IVVEEEIDLVLLDLNLGSTSGLDVLKALKDIDPELLVIIITGYGTVESAVESLKMGAYDYIKKPFKADAIHLIVRLALETQELRREVRHLKRGSEALASAMQIVGASEEMKRIYSQIQEVAKHEAATVLITGESGTGKELVAKAIHNLSPRSAKPFVEINCGSLPYNLLESELFGYEKGAFTDAKTRKIGLLEEASGGTLFLDEIGEMDMSLQVKLLRVIEDRKFRRLGNTRNIDIDVRIIAATNRDLKRAIDEKQFREDLYYRLNVFPIRLPALRERKEDIPNLLDFFIKKFSTDFKKKVKDIARPALNLFMEYPWPGNVRELKNVVERICIMTDAEVITEDVLPQEIRGSKVRREAPSGAEVPAEGLVLDDAVSRYEESIIRKALTMTDGNVAQASKLLGTARGTLRYKLDKYKIEHNDH
ncbi:MAG: sigma-54 dependent transcriptional regulator, partial [Geovibrio sp.]|nr:sigma-54 dependent transcriptional regulator [Geovibrio sp.]